MNAFLGILFAFLFSLFGFGVKGLDSTCLCTDQHISKRNNLWRLIQARACDTVVQIFAQGAPLDLIHPYRTPDQVCSTGSGFFINENGDIATNAHVVDQAIGIWVQIPSMGKRPINATLISICPERDLALLQLSDEGREYVCQTLGEIPFLPLGDSDSVYRADEVLVLGYPLGQQSLKSTTGVISGREQHLIQMDAAISPGSSGGPMLDMNGQVIGISAIKCIGQDIDNVGYAIPINTLKIILDDMHVIPLLRRPFLGLVMSNATDELTDYLGNPQPGGCYAVEVVKDSTLYKAGLRGGDMIYEVDENHLDIYGEMAVPGIEDKISIINYISRLKIGQEVALTVYRAGKCKKLTATVTQHDLPAIHEVHPGYEEIDYEIFAGMVVMQLTTNHIRILARQVPGLIRYTETKNQDTPVLLVTHVFHNSEMNRSRTLYSGVTINEVNGIKIETLDDFRNTVLQGANDEYFIVKATDTASGATDNLLVVLSMDSIAQEEPMLAQAYRYGISPLAQEVIDQRGAA